MLVNCGYVPQTRRPEGPVRRPHPTYSVCKDFPRESSGIGCGGPVEGGMAVVRRWLRESKVDEGTDCVFANGLVAQR